MTTNERFAPMHSYFNDFKRAMNVALQALTLSESHKEEWRTAISGLIPVIEGAAIAIGWNATVAVFAHCQIIIDKYGNFSGDGLYSPNTLLKLANTFKEFLILDIQGENSSN